MWNDWCLCGKTVEKLLKNSSAVIVAPTGAIRAVYCFFHSVYWEVLDVVYSVSKTYLELNEKAEYFPAQLWSSYIFDVVYFVHLKKTNKCLFVFLGYYFCSLFCIASLFRASVADPGKLPENPKIPITGTLNCFYIIE